MTRSLVLRRMLTVTLVIGTAMGGLGAIRVAADWTATAAPLEASPIAADELRARLADEKARSTTLEDRLATLTSHATQLESALATAQARLDADNSNAQELAAQLAAAKDKLAALERSIRKARAVSPTVVVTTSSGAGSGSAVSEGESDDD